MKKILLWAVLLLGGFVFTGCRHKSPGGIEHVVLIGLDGMSSWGLMEARTPCMDSLMTNGACSFSVRSILPSVSMPNWTAMMTGTGPEATGVTDNGWVNGVSERNYVAVDRENRTPTIFTIIGEQMPDAVMGCVHNWGDFPNMYDRSLLELDEDYQDDVLVAQRTAKFIKERKPDFMFCYFGEPDGQLHRRGHLSSHYIGMIETLDDCVRTVVDAVRDAGIADKTVIMVLSDHGGRFHAHGGIAHEELTTPIIFYGKGVKKGYRIREQVYSYDLAANVAFALGLTPPEHWTGRPTESVYKGFEEPGNIWPEAEVLPSPTFVTKERKSSGYFGGYWVDAPATVRIATRPDVRDVVEVRYTLDLSTPTPGSALYEGPFELDGPAVLQAKVFGEKDVASVTVQSEYRVADTEAGNGMTWSVYHCPEYSFMPESFAQMKPVATGTCFEFGFNPPENDYDTGLDKALGLVKDHFGYVAQGLLEIDADDIYTFNTWSTGGSKLYIDDQLVVNNAGNDHTGNNGQIALKKGRHRIRVEYFDIDAPAGAILSAAYSSKNSVPGQIIPAQKLFKNK